MRFPEDDYDSKMAALRQMERQLELFERSLYLHTAGPNFRRALWASRILNRAINAEILDRGAPRR